MADLFAGVELGGTKCILLLARGPDEIIERVQLDTGDPDDTLSSIEHILARWQSATRFEALGIGSFGPLNLDPASPRYGEVTNSPKLRWRGARVLSRLSAAAGVPARIDTDVNGAALAEIRWGSGRGYEDFAYITVGTGVGVGLIVNGQPTRGFSHCELGHIRTARLPGDEWKGSCPFHGDCVEGLASGPALKARLGSELALQLDRGHPVWKSVSWALAQLCHTIVCAAAPRAIAIGGGVVEGNPHLIQEVQEMLVESLAGYVEIPASRQPYVGAPVLGSGAGPLGAIALAMTARD
ncbi:MAG TPA: ROK family protein [Sphingomicrobium sp.]|nr:ROK family protein [Sphingomicrobium sp.]